jgi:hypothetical protein
MSEEIIQCDQKYPVGTLIIDWHDDAIGIVYEHSTKPTKPRLYRVWWINIVQDHTDELGEMFTEETIDSIKELDILSA